MLMLNDMTRDDVEIVEFPYPDDWYDKPEMLDPRWTTRPSCGCKRDHKHDSPSARWRRRCWRQGRRDLHPEQALPAPAGGDRQVQGDRGPVRYPDWTLQVANIPAVITCTDVMAEEHPELVVTFMKAMIKVGRWANEHKHAAAAILDRQTFYRDVEDTYQGIKDVDMVPNLPQNLQPIEIGKDFMLSHGYIKNDFDVQQWAAPEFLEQADDMGYPDVAVLEGGLAAWTAAGLPVTEHEYAGI
jgi:hypothetical protein